MSSYFKILPRQKRRNFLSSWLSRLNMTGWLILSNVIFFIIFSLFGALSYDNCNNSICKYIAIQPINLFQNGYWWTLISSMFMHAGILHLFINMLSLYFIGTFLEMIIGKKRFFWLYILSGIFAGLFFAFFPWFFGIGGITEKIFGSPNTFAVGASGAIFGIAGVLALLTPRNKVYLIAGPIIAIILQTIVEKAFPNAVFINLFSIIVSMYIFFSIFSMFSFSDNLKRLSLPIKMSFWLLPIVAIVPLFIIGYFIDLPIGNTAHLGGFIAGVGYGLYLRYRYKKKCERIADYFC